MLEKSRQLMKTQTNPEHVSQPRSVREGCDLMGENLIISFPGKLEKQMFAICLFLSWRLRRARTALLVFISENFQLTRGLALLHAAHGRTPGPGVFEEASAARERLQLPWNKVARSCTDGTPAMAGLNEKQIPCFSA